MEPGDVHLSELVYGQRDSDSVRRLQQALNDHPLAQGRTIALTGDYLDLTDREVRKCQQQHGFGSDPARGSSVGPRQAEHLFAGTGNTIKDDSTKEDPVGALALWMRYSGKPAGTIRIVEADDWVVMDFDVDDPPLSGSEHHMMYARINFTWKPGAEAAKVECKYVREDDDETAFDERHYEHGTRSVPFQQVHFEEGHAGIGGRWHMRVHGGVSAMELTTRYCKTHVIGTRP